MKTIEGTVVSEIKGFSAVNDLMDLNCASVNRWFQKYSSEFIDKTWSIKNYS